MSLRDAMNWLVGREQPLQTRADGSIEDLVSRLQPLRTSPWRSATNREAMGVPAVFKAISLISNTVGTLSMEAYRNGTRLDSDDTPRIVVRPDPFATPYDFWQNSAYHKARRGETWWWVARRDSAGLAISILSIDPREITVERNPRNALRPIIRWQGVEMPNDDMKLMKYLPDPNDLQRGIGPLQACGAAVSVAVEAQEYAANFFAGNPSNTWIKMALDVSDDEALAVKASWMADSSGLPKVTGTDVDSVTDISVEPQKAQLSEIRLQQNGEVALMYSMPPTLLNYAVQGSTITYQNVGQIADDFLRQCLLPHYLEPMEQVMSDLLPRRTVGRFSVQGLLRADIKTRFDVHAIAIDKGIYDAAYADRLEGITPGDVENRPVPFAAPEAIPASLPVQIRSRASEVRCACGKLLAEMASAPYRFTCPRCKAAVAA